jgi:hypothetical protein
MIDDLRDLTDSLRNLVARPGTFTDTFPETTDDDLVAVLLDGFAEAHLEGLMTTVDADEDGLFDTEITRGQGALIVLLAGVRFLRGQLVNTTSHRRYEAGGAVFEEDTPVALLRDILKDLVAQKDRLIGDLVDAETAGAGARIFVMADQAYIRLTGYSPYGSVASW